MLERIVDAWLTNAGERGFERAFAQLLAVEGHRILHGPVHHPFEHGKDLVTIAPDGKLSAFQLKGEDLGRTDVDRMFGQLMSLVATAVTYPGIEPPRAPDRVFLVTAGVLTPPARDAVRSFNDANRARGLPPVEVNEREQLASRFVAAHGQFLPTAVRSLNAFLDLLLSDGSGPFPLEKFSSFVDDSLDGLDATASNAEARRAFASLTLLCSYVAGPWQRLENHIGAAEAWLAGMFTILHRASLHGRPDDAWRLSFELCRDAARAELRTALVEAANAEDLLQPDIGEGLVYGARALLVLGYCSAFVIAESLVGDVGDYVEPLDRLIRRELSFVKAAGEYAASAFLMVANALQATGNVVRGAAVMFRWTRELAIANNPRDEQFGAIPDPYHRVEECLLKAVSDDGDEEGFDGHAYTLHVGAEWLARRGYRDLLADVWPRLTRITLCEFRPHSPVDVLAYHTDAGELLHWIVPLTGSWPRIREQARRVGELDLAAAIWRDPYVLPLLVMLYPHRLSSTIGKALDHFVFPTLCERMSGESALTDPTCWGTQEEREDG